MMCGLMHLIFTSFASKATAASENLAAVAHNNMLLLHTEASNSHTHKAWHFEVQTSK